MLLRTVPTLPNSGIMNRCLISDNNNLTFDGDEQNHAKESEEDASVEGGVVRNLFQMYSSSSSCSLATTATAADEEEDPSDDPLTYIDPTVQDQSHILHKMIVNDVILAQKGMKTISNILWPSASFLASFVFNFYKEYVIAPSFAPSAAPSTTPTPRNYKASHLICPPPNTDLNSQQECLEDLYETLATPPSTYFSILELGAGVGYTGLKLAMELPCKVQLTDLEEALPLLTENIRLNSHQFHLGPSAVSCVPLLWGTPQESYLSSVIQPQNDRKWLILASDCVYYEELHLPLEQTLATLLSNQGNSSTSSHHQLCLLAGMRRWKRDTAFYSKLGRRTRTSTHTLQCTCLHEVVERPSSNMDHRNIFRIYAVRWVARSTT